MQANTQISKSLHIELAAFQKSSNPNRPQRSRRLKRWTTMALCGIVTWAAGIAFGADDSWPMFQANPAHTGYVPVTLNPTNFALRWQTTIHSGVSLNPVTEGEGKVFVTEYGYFSNAGLYVLSATNGDLLWNDNYGSIFSVNPPSYAYGNVYIQTCDNYADTFIHAYQAATGALVFRSAFGAQWERYYAPTIYDGKVYVDGGTYGGMYGFDAYSGTESWFSYLNQYDQWTPAVDDNYAYAYTGDYSPNLSVINRLTGVEAFSIPDPEFQWNGWSMDLAPVLGSTNDVLAIHDGRLIFFDLAARDIRWQLRSNFEGQPSLAKGVIYAINAGALEARDELTGSLLWAWEVPSDNLIGTMIVTDSHLLARTGSAVYAVNLKTHLSDWSYPVSGNLALGDGVLYVAGANGTLTAITAQPVPANQPPVSRPGGPYTTECNGAVTTVQLDGSASSDPDGDTLTFHWSSDCSDATFSDPSSPKPLLTINATAAQACTVTLTVSDGMFTNTNQTTVSVTDTQPPVLSQISATPSTLWPPNHKMVPVTVTAQVTDACDPAPVYQIVSVVSSDSTADPGVKQEPDFQITSAHTVLLRAERSNARLGRTYWVLLQAEDAGGNTATNAVTVNVPGAGQ